MNKEDPKEAFKKALREGKPVWKQMPYNGQEGQPCHAGCIIRQRIAPPHDYVLDGDCRAPASDKCCMNIQDAKRIRQ